MRCPNINLILYFSDKTCGQFYFEKDIETTQAQNIYLKRYMLTKFLKPLSKWGFFDIGPHVFGIAAESPH